MVKFTLAMEYFVQFTIVIEILGTKNFYFATYLRNQNLMQVTEKVSYLVCKVKHIQREISLRFASWWLCATLFSPQNPAKNLSQRMSFPLSRLKIISCLSYLFIYRLCIPSTKECFKIRIFFKNMLCNNFSKTAHIHQVVCWIKMEVTVANENVL